MMFIVSARAKLAHWYAVVEYLQSAAYHHRMEFEQAHHSQSGYVRALSFMAALYPEVDLLPFYRPS
ncbi:hypothetical protein ACLOJK_015260 [Asimina triloba]